MISVFEVAKYILYLSRPGTDMSVTHLKLQKLLYYSQGWHLAIQEEPLFKEKIEAWIHGPVCACLYYHFKNYGFSVIPRIEDNIYIPKPSKDIIHDVWEVYGSFSGGYLEQMSHKEEPWLRARGNLEVNQHSNNEISLEIMRNYFKNKYYEVI